MGKAKIGKEQILTALELELTVWECMERFNCSKETVKNTLKRHGIKSPKGFYSRGLKIGRPKGIPWSEEQRQYFSSLFSGAGNPFYGKHHTEETRKKMSENHANFTGERNPFRQSLEECPQKREEHRRRCRKIWASRDEDWHIRHSEVLSHSMASSQNTKGMNYKRHKRGWIETKKAGRQFYRSSWELQVCQILDSLDCILEFDLEPFTVPYTTKKGKKRWTRIDFFVVLMNGTKLIFEVKPKNLMDYNKNREKVAALKAYCEDRGWIFWLIHKQDIETLAKKLNDMKGAL